MKKGKKRNIQKALSNDTDKQASEKKKRMPAGSGVESRRVALRLNNFDPQTSNAVCRLKVKFPGATHNELREAAEIVSAKLKLKLDRDAKRDNRVLLKWYDENWHEIHEYMERIHFLNADGFEITQDLIEYKNQIIQIDSVDTDTDFEVPIKKYSIPTPRKPTRSPNKTIKFIKPPPSRTYFATSFSDKFSFAITTPALNEATFTVPAINEDNPSTFSSNEFYLLPPAPRPQFPTESLSNKPPFSTTDLDNYFFNESSISEYACHETSIIDSTFNEPAINENIFGESNLCGSIFNESSQNPVNFNLL